MTNLKLRMQRARPLYGCSLCYKVLAQRRQRLVNIFRRNAERLLNRLMVLVFNGNVALARQIREAHEILANVNQLLARGASQAEGVHAVAMK